MKTFPKNESWDSIRLANQEYLNIPPQISDYIAILDIARLCSTGLSNKSIARMSDISIDYVEHTIETFFRFEGWKEDLDISSWLVYGNKKNYAEYYRTMTTLSPLSKEDVLESYKICKIYEAMLEEVDNYYDDGE